MAKIPKSVHPSTPVFGWLRKRVEKIQMESPALSLMSPAGRKQRYREIIFSEVGRRGRIRTQLEGLKSVSEMGTTPFRRRVTVFFSAKSTQTVLKKLTNPTREKIKSLGDLAVGNRISAIYEIASLIRRRVLPNEMIPFLHFAIKDPHPDVVVVAIRELMGLKDLKETKRSPEVVSKALSSSYPEVVRMALKCLVAYRYPAAIPKAIQLMRFIGNEKRSSSMIRKLGREASHVEMVGRGRQEDSYRKNAASYVEQFIDSPFISIALKNESTIGTLFTNLTDSLPEIRHVSAQILANHPEVLSDKEIRMASKYILSEKNDRVKAQLLRLVRSVA